MKYNKLVRDKIPEILDQKGVSYTKTIVDGAEYHKRLFEKLTEEVDELREAQNTEEMADVLEVIDALITELGIERSELEKVKQEKFNERGGFYQRIVLEGEK